VVFTSRRMYGNVATMDPFTSDPRDSGYDYEIDFNTKKLWVAAVNLTGTTPGMDPSHPAFYLPAQEIHAGNSRGFWTVDPCHADGTSCQTGDECCNGFCEPGGDAGGLICGSYTGKCSMENERCTKDSDCCPPDQSIDPGNTMSLQCINNLCVYSTPPIM
jgi:hypothetical protein